MKSADPEDLLKLKLAERPLDEQNLVSVFTSDNFLMNASVLAKCVVQTTKQLEDLQSRMSDMQKSIDEGQQETRKMLLELVSSNDRKITETKLARFFTTASYLLNDYDYDFNKKTILFKNIALEKDAEEIAFLSLSLEEYFGTSHISFSILLNAIKRYFAIKKKQNFAIKDFLDDFCEETLANTKTKKRTRIYFKNLKLACEDCLDITPKIIKDTMRDLGYEEKTDASRIVFFEKVKQR